MAPKDKRNDVQADANAPQAEPQQPEPQAPPQPEPQQAGPVNRFRAMFEELVFEPKDGQTYENSDGSKVKQIAAGLAIFCGGHAAIPIKVSVRQTKAGKQLAEANFIGTRTTNSMKALDAAAQAELDEFRRYMAAEYATWRVGDGANVTAKAKAATGIEISGIDLG